MWSRTELKTNAKTAIKRYYWVAVAVCIVYTVVSGMQTGFLTADQITKIVSQFGIQSAQDIAELTKSYEMWTSIIGLLVMIFVFNPIIVGANRYFMESRSFKSSFKSLFFAFKGGRYIKIVKVMLIRDAKILLWTCLFIVPGLIKTYEYHFIPYLLAENPDLTTQRYFEITKSMSNNEKFNIFVLELSFVGWNILGVLTCGIGFIFLRPYIYATYAELYAVMRAKMFTMDLANAGELPDFLPPAAPQL